MYYAFVVPNEKIYANDECSVHKKTMYLLGQTFGTKKQEKSSQPREKSEKMQ